MWISDLPQRNANLGTRASLAMFLPLAFKLKVLRGTIQPNLMNFPGDLTLLWPVRCN